MGATLRLPEHEEASLLCNAAATSDAGLLASLLAAGALPSACDYDGRTALHIAACAGSPVLAGTLLRSLRRPIGSLKDRWGHTPEDEARRRGFKPVLEVLRGTRADGT